MEQFFKVSTSLLLFALIIGLSILGRRKIILWYIRFTEKMNWEIENIRSWKR